MIFLIFLFFSCFCLCPRCRSRCGSCGRLIGRIPTNSGPNPRDPLGAMTKKPKTYYSKTLNNRTGGANKEYRGGPGGPGTGFCSPGGGFFSLSRRSGLPLRLLSLKPPPGLEKPVPGPPGPPLYSLLAPPVRLLSVLE